MERKTIFVAGQKISITYPQEASLWVEKNLIKLQLGEKIMVLKIDFIPQIVEGEKLPIFLRFPGLKGIWSTI